ncbi:MAG: hypothetical protein CMJ84_00185 [Planctomycetes bacterium]|nr:hypothetical protein [Planctomycetota bacterium]
MEPLVTDTLKPILKPLASLRLTVVLLAASIFLIFASTWAQIDRGIWDVMRAYFRNYYVWIDFQIFLPRDWDVPGGIYWPGGFLLGALLVLNLLAAHTVRFKLNWKRSGIILIHVSLLLFLLGEGITGHFALETQMPIYEGQTVSWSQDIRESELAIVDTSPADHDRVVVVPASMLDGAFKHQRVIAHAAMPFDIKVEQFFENASLIRLPQDGSIKAQATQGFGLTHAVRRAADVSGVEGGGINLPAAVVEFQRDGESLGKYVVTIHFQNDDYIYAPQKVEVAGQTYDVYLRFRRHYKPYAIKLIDFRHDKYTGTEIARNFSSDIQLIDPTHSEDRPAKIYMNNPLRYGGDTLYQADWIKPARGTVLQVVANPGWQIPYVAFALASLGLLVHFGIVLGQFLRRNRVARAAVVPSNVGGVMGQYLPWAAGVLCLVYLIWGLRPPQQTSPFEVPRFASLPVSYQGRVKPLDTVARNALLALNGRQSLKHEGLRITAAHWLTDLMTRRDIAFEYEVFRIDHPEVLALFGWDKTNKKRFSYNDIGPQREQLLGQADQVNKVPQKQRNSFQVKLLQLAQNVMFVFEALATHQELHPMPPLDADHDWMTLQEAAAHSHASGRLPRMVEQYAGMLQSYSEQNADTFNDTLATYRGDMVEKQPDASRKARFEAFFNYFAPFARARVLYVVAGLLVMFSWLGWRGPLGRAAFMIVVITLVLHTCGLAARVYLSGRPPVTNLYSSAVFIGWGCVLFCLVMERLFRNGVGTLIASVSGFLTLLVAWALAGDGDTMAVLQAVLDTNFWLATHVVCITLGYSATFLAGAVGAVFILGGLFTSMHRGDGGKRIGQMQYGIIAFALLLSLIGTVLGGIWADQSWGRFWGWDPKENGALLIVLWNALILHARWGGLAKARGVAVLAVFGNIVTSWSYFGTNMLGVGLHAYGFIDSAVFWLGTFVFSQLALMGFGLVPLRLWRSFAVVQLRPQDAAAGNRPTPQLAS